jgi:hypothetical protein
LFSAFSLLVMVEKMMGNGEKNKEFLVYYVEGRVRG